MNADFLVLKIQDEADSVAEIQDGELLPLGSRELVSTLLEGAFPSIRWQGPASGVWWSGEVFCVEILFSSEEEPVGSLTLKVRLNPKLEQVWLDEDEEELEGFLVALCDPHGWSLFDVGSGRRFRFSDEQDGHGPSPVWEAGPVN